MDRIGPAGGSPTATLTNGQQGFVDENLSAGTEGTTVVAEWMNAVQEELMSILAAGSVSPNIATYSQVLQALGVLFGGTQSSFGGSVSTSSIYMTLPGGVIVQVGQGTFPNSGAVTSAEPVTFPKAFPTKAIGIFGCCGGDANTTNGGLPSWGVPVASISRTGFTAAADTLNGEASTQIIFNQTVPFFWMAFGY